MKFIAKSIKETRALGATLARVIKPADIVCLSGDLGAGKTVLTKAIARGMGIKPSEVTSPTFVLIREYKDGKIPLFHFDLYRLRNSKEIIDIGYEEYLYGRGVSVIEWADRLGCLMPKEYLSVTIFIRAKERREFVITAFGERYRRMIKDLMGRT